MVYLPHSLCCVAPLEKGPHNKTQKVRTEIHGCWYAMPQVEGSEERWRAAQWEINTRDTERDWWVNSVAWLMWQPLRKGYGSVGNTIVCRTWRRNTVKKKAKVMGDSKLQEYPILMLYCISEGSSWKYSSQWLIFTHFSNDTEFYNWVILIHCTVSVSLIWITLSDNLLSVKQHENMLKNKCVLRYNSAC